APFAIPHICSEDTIVNFNGHDYFFPKNTQIIPNLNGANRNEIEFDDPNTFNPERHPSSTASHVSYSSGPRSCPGENMADDVLFIVSTRLYKYFKFDRTTNQLYDEYGVLTKSLTPKDYLSKVS
ncbi:hypothetical protein DICPUDRAFT_38792, partial [Dictyostelium purpureum]